MSNQEEKGKMQKEISSFKGASNLNVAHPEVIKKSFNGAVKLRPTNIPTQKPVPQPAAPPPQKVDTGKKK